MSAETYDWLNKYTLIGFTEKRGNAWHYREDKQGSEPNHYKFAIPVEDVLRRLFNFTVDPCPVFVPGEPKLTDTGVEPTFVQVPDKQAWRASDNGDVLGIFSDGYLGHQYEEWLLTHVANLIDDDLSIGSAGLLRNRAQAWVSIEIADNIVTPSGVEFRPNLLAGTSFDGSLATTYKRVNQIIVCDNTLAAGLAEEGQEIKVRHSRYSHLKLNDARDALAIVHQLAEDFEAEVERLCNWEVSKKQWSKHLDLIVPVPEEKGRSRSIAENKRSQLVKLYSDDPRVAPWAGSAWGVVQAHNTWLHHVKTVKGTSRALRNQENALSGKTDVFDREIIKTLALVTA